MADDPAALILRMQGDLSKLEKDLNKAGVLTDKAVADIENRFAKLNPGIPGAAMQGFIQGIGQAFGNTVIDGARQFAAALVEVQKQLVLIADLSKLSGLSTNRLQELQFAASIGGVSPSEFRRGVEGIGKALNESRAGETDLSRLFDANNLKLKDRRGNVISINEALLRGADLIRNAATEFDKIKIAELLGLSREWVRALEGGGAAFSALATEAQAAGAIIDQNTIAKAVQFQREWEKATARWSAQFQAALGEILPDLIALVDKGAQLLNYVNEWTKKLNVAAKLQSGATLDFKEAQTAMATLRANGVEPSDEFLKQYNDAAERAREAARAQAAAAPRMKLEITKDVTQPTTVIPERKSSGGGSSEDAFTRAQEQIVKRIATIEAETATIGLNTEARDRARTVATLEEAAKQANTRAGRENTEVTDEQRAVIEQLADRYYAAAAAARQAQEAQRSWNDMTQAFGSIAAEGFSGVIKKTQSLSDALTNAANRMIDLVVQAALLGSGPLAGILGFANSTGGTGGIFGALLGGLPRFAGGGVSNTPSIFAEAGPEAAVPLPDGRRIPVDLRTPQVATQQQVVNNRMQISIDLTGANGDAAIAAAARQGAAAGASAAMRATPGIARSTFADDTKRRR